MVSAIILHGWLLLLVWSASATGGMNLFGLSWRPRARELRAPGRAGRMQPVFASAAGTGEASERLEKDTASEPEGKSFYGFLLGFIFNTVGFSFLIYGKKKGRFIILACGILLMGYPYILSNTYAIVGVGVALCMAPMVLKRFGLDV